MDKASKVLLWLRRFWAQRFELAVLVLGIVLVVGFQQQKLDLLVYDQLMQNLDNRHENHVVVIEIDDKSIAYLGEWPWPRETHTAFLKQLENTGVVAVGLDIIFPAKDATDFSEDIELANQMQSSLKVVLPVAPKVKDIGHFPELLPHPNLAQASHALGHVDFEVDVDGTVRRSYLFAGYKTANWPAFGLALANIKAPTLPTADKNVQRGDGWVRSAEVLVNFALPPGYSELPSLSYVDILNRNFEPQWLRNKILLVGMNATAMGDQFATPISVNNKTMPGVVVNGHFVNSLVNNNYLTQLTAQKQLLMVLGILLVALISLSLTRPRFLRLMLFANLTLIAVTSYILLTEFDIWFAPVASVAALLIVYVMISLIKTSLFFGEFERLQYAAYRDAQTKLFNEQGFIKYIDDKHSDDSTGLRFDMFYIEIGMFKGLGDLYGETLKRGLLQHLVEVISTVSNKRAQIARSHDANFLLALPCNSESDPISHAQRLRLALSKTIYVEGETFKLPVNIGICQFPQDVDSPQSLMAVLEVALSRAKEQQNHGICIYNKDIKEALIARKRLETDLENAIIQDQMDIHYQPQVDAASGAIIGAEALARWSHPARGQVSPADFIPVAESTGFIIELGNWVLHKACKQAKHWQSIGVKDFRVAVNVSSKQFAHPTLIDVVESALTSANLEPQYLELELTESCVVENFNEAVTTLNRLKSLGVALSIDDFGTGYSSLSYLKHFPMDRLKIDKSFVEEVVDDAEAQDITKAIISMAHSLNMKVIAEGIESQAQSSFLMDCQCEELQGYLFGKPATAAAISVLLETQTSAAESLDVVT